MLERIVSGGQTGVDRAALDAAGARGIARGGWCPAGRWAEDGPVPDDYPLRETPSADPAERTAWNVRDADATLVLAPGPPHGGSALSLAVARELGRPVVVVDLAAAPDPQATAAWLTHRRVRVLNVAGPRESQAPGVAAEARDFLVQVLAALAPAQASPTGAQSGTDSR